jgi:hypothetical protein
MNNNGLTQQARLNNMFYQDDRIDEMDENDQDM